MKLKKALAAAMAAVLIGGVIWSHPAGVLAKETLRQSVEQKDYIAKSVNLQDVTLLEGNSASLWDTEDKTIFDFHKNIDYMFYTSYVNVNSQDDYSLVITDAGKRVLKESTSSAVDSSITVNAYYGFSPADIFATWEIPIKITQDGENYKFYDADGDELTAIVFPEVRYEWRTGDESIAKVTKEDGVYKLQALKEGQTTYAITGYYGDDIIFMRSEAQITVESDPNATQPPQTQEPVEPAPSSDAAVSEEPQPSESVQPSETAQPSESVQPSETVQPSESAQPGETVQPSESVQPSETVQPSESTQPSEVPDGMFGDMNGDGEVDLTDVQTILQAYLDMYEMTPEQKKLADMNEDSDVDLTDVQLALQKYLD